MINERLDELGRLALAAYEACEAAVELDAKEPRDANAVKAANLAHCEAEEALRAACARYVGNRPRAGKVVNLFRGRR